MPEEQKPASAGEGSSSSESDKTAVWTPTSQGAGYPSTDEKTMVLPSAHIPSSTPSSNAPGSSSLASSVSHAEGPLRAKFLLRFVGRWIDSCLLSIAGFSLGMLLGGFSMAGALTAALGFLYFGAAHSWKGQTLGKKLMGLKLVEESGAKVAYKKAFIRALADWLNVVTMGLGYLLIFTKRQQPLHDILCKTKVVVVTRRPMWALLAGFLLPSLVWVGFYFSVGVSMFSSLKMVEIKQTSAPQTVVSQETVVPQSNPSEPTSAVNESASKKPESVTPPEPLSSLEDEMEPMALEENLAKELEKKAIEYFAQRGGVDPDSCKNFSLLGNVKYRKLVIQSQCGAQTVRLIAVKLQKGWRVVRPMKSSESLDPKTGVFRQQ